MRLGVLTGGGDCPGTNAVLRAIVRKATLDLGATVVGFLDAWDGVLNDDAIDLTPDVVRGILSRGGTILGTRRGSPLEREGGVERVREVLRQRQVDTLVVIGGNGSLTVASILHDEHGIPIIGVPKTIDNDVVGTEYTFGFNTAVQIATDAIDRLHTTAESHDRIMVVEVMGRDSGWIALHAGIAGGATAIAIPEQPFDIDELARLVTRRHDRGRYASVVVLAEGSMPIPGTLDVPIRKRDGFGHRVYGDLAQLVAPRLTELTGYEARVTQLGYVQRGGTPTSYDRVLSTQFGLAAVDAVRDGALGMMVALSCGAMTLVPLATAKGVVKRVDVAQFADVSALLG
jgi:phosphofructokinase-like protein